ncbi:hypothetical protein BN961_02729 [Afipia felis]|uniref:Uncharacterized protein n=1 Tax=Afipia felis TaxID=1035 RepID=A0A090MUA8_AFIFE|nr:hypothetical protein BN961_02729 [Afipia felis]
MRRPFAVSDVMSSEGAGSITASLSAATPCASQPDNIAPPILPAPASTMEPFRFASALVDVVIEAASRDLLRHGRSNHRFANCLVRDARVKPGHEGRAAQASPIVSNIAADIASVAVLPLQTTNWKAGK